MKTVVITGGTKGIGAEIARGFLSDGWYVIIAARNKSGLAEENHDNLKFQKMDVRVEADHQALVKTAFNWSGSLDCYINCAGFSQWSQIKNVDETFWNKMLDINLKGTFWGCKVAAEHLSSGGSIVNVSSLAGKRGSANNSVYCATKFGVDGITQAGLLEALKNPEAPPKGQDTAKYLKEFSESNAALERLPKGNEIAELCFYLSSSKASAITGQCINVDCGVLPQ